LGNCCRTQFVSEPTFLLKYYWLFQHLSENSGLRILYSRKREDPDLTLAVQPLKIKQCVCACTRYNNCHISRVQLKFVHVEIVQPVRLSELCQVPFQRPSVCTGLNADLVSTSRATPVLSIVIIWIYRFIAPTL